KRQPMASARITVGSAEHGRRAESAAEVHVQEFTVAYRYPVYFTADALDPANPTLVDAVGRTEPDRRHRIFVVVAGGVASAWPDLCAAVARYAAAHPDALELTAPPEVVPGGEPAKNDATVVARLHARLHALRIDRHSFVVVVGGGAVQDAAGYAA